MPGGADFASACAGGLQFFANVSVGKPAQHFTLLLSSAMGSMWLFCPKPGAASSLHGWAEPTGSPAAVFELALVGLVLAALLGLFGPALLRRCNVRRWSRRAPTSCDVDIVGTTIHGL